MNSHNNIIVYTKTGCPWRKEVLDYLEREHLSYVEKNMTDHPEYRLESEQATGQSKCPTICVDGHWIPDGDSQQLKSYLESLSQ